MDRELIEKEVYKRYPNKYDRFQTLHVITECLCNGFIEGAEWMQEEFTKEKNLRGIRLDTIKCCEEYYKRFGTFDGIYEHYFADVTEK